jgi:epoxyqueuosine reductase
MPDPDAPPTLDCAALAERIKARAHALGFQRVGITRATVDPDAAHLEDWLSQGLHGDMHWMQRHAALRTSPSALQPGTLSVVSVGLDYAQDDTEAWLTLADPERAYVARYALGADYHKLMRKRLQRLADWIAAEAGPFGHRVFVDSAPVLERALARNAGLGWIGKHTCLIDRDGGSWFFLGELFTDLALPADPPASAHCGRCTRCIDICPTQAITAPYRLDARRCIAYLTIEHDGSIDEPLRPLIGNRIFGCDDCQLVCPWNKFARRTDEPAFRARNGLDRASLLDLFAWSEAEFLQRSEGSTLRRSGWRRWRRNLAIALGNAPASGEIRAALAAEAEAADPVIREHVRWALEQQARKHAAD